MFFTTSSSASCNEETLQPKMSGNRGPRGCTWRDPRLWVSPSSLPVTTLYISICLQRMAVLALEREIAQKPLPFCQAQGSSSPSRLKAARGTEFWGASSLLPTCGGARPPVLFSPSFFRAEQTALIPPILLNLKQAHFFLQISWTFILSCSYLPATCYQDNIKEGRAGEKDYKLYPQGLR